MYSDEPLYSNSLFHHYLIRFLYVNNVLMCIIIYIDFTTITIKKTSWKDTAEYQSELDIAGQFVVAQLEVEHSEAKVAEIDYIFHSNIEFKYLYIRK